MKKSVVRPDREPVSIRTDHSSAAIDPMETVDSDPRTRHRVLELIMAAGSLTAADLATELNLSTAGIRRHLGALTESGLVESSQQRVYGSRGRGRPAKAYRVTEKARVGFGHQYDDLAIAALRLMRQADPQLIEAFAAQRAAQVVAGYEKCSAEKPESGPTETLARAMDELGYVASVSAVPQGEQLCQHHCPVAHVAAEFPELCAAETQAISEVLGVHVQRLATIADGSGVCCTHIPQTSTTSQTSTQKGQS